MGFQDYIALSVAAVAVWFTARTLWRSMAGESTSCSSCPSSKTAEHESPKLKRTPLVTLNTAELQKHMD